MSILKKLKQITVLTMIPENLDIRNAISGDYMMIQTKLSTLQKKTNKNQRFFFSKNTKNNIIIKVFMQNKCEILKEHPQNIWYAIFEEKLHPLSFRIVHLNLRTQIFRFAH